jgi:hypothetical protein
VGTLGLRAVSPVWSRWVNDGHIQLTKAVVALAIDGKNRVECHSGLVTCCQEIVVECQDFGAAGAAQWHHSLPGKPGQTV